MEAKQQDAKGRAGSSEKESFAVAAPAITLPKGGGAIRGIGEKFAANPVTGTGSMSVPIATSPGRSGFGPQLSLSYDSGAGNGPFGLGWNLSLPSITRKTDKGLPRYRDAEESDEFVLSGAEDLVPVLIEKDGGWERENLNPRTVHGQTYHIQRYRPRIEGLFARIERWTNQADPTDRFWRSISKDNITTWYGKSSKSRIADPADNSRIFSWLICESHDDKGNVVVYDYKVEDSRGVSVSSVHERNRTDDNRRANRYLKSIRYGNRQPYFPMLGGNGASTPIPANWLFEVVFDYGEHDATAPAPGDNGDWQCRNDPFSSYRSGFEVRTYRLCQRVLMFHHFKDEPGVGESCLVRSTDFKYRYEDDPTDPRNPIHSVLVSVTQSGYKRKDDGSYLQRSLPPLDFAYSQASIDETVREVDAESLENLPYGLDGSVYQWVDLDGEGLSGVLTEQAGAWCYKRNLSPANTQTENGQERTTVKLGPLERVTRKPSFSLAGAGGAQLLDLAGDGQLDLVEMGGPTPGFFERTHDEDWEPFRAFESLPILNWGDPNLRFVDLTGDGHADILISEDIAFCWYPSLAEAGFATPERVRQALDEERGPRLVFADGTQSIYLADMSGDGLTDLVRIRNGEVCYWPNLGYGRFGAKVTMDNAPWFDSPDQFDQKRIRLADIDGSGVTDIIYLKADGPHIYLNHSGNSWSQGRRLEYFPPIDNLSSVLALDLLGNGTACLVWSSPLPGHARCPVKYIDLMGGQKPHLLVRSSNNLGAETVLHYAPSTKFYVKDKEAGRPWITRIPFPVHVVECVESCDHISRNRFVTRYAYHHGCFDGEEREFRGFGMVEQWDTDEIGTAGAFSDAATTNRDETSFVPPVHTKTWFHTGVYLGRDRVSNYFAGLLDARDVGEYYPQTRSGDAAADTAARALLLDDTILPTGWTVDEEREACRALKGSMLRQEVYAQDRTEKAAHPYTVTEQNFTIQRIQAKAGNPHGVFFAHPREAINYHYERNPDDPRTQHALTLEVDRYGNVRKSVAIGYGRKPGKSPLRGEDKDKQERLLVTYTENDVTNAIDLPVNDPGYDPDNYRSPMPSESRTYEVTGLKPTGTAARFDFENFARDQFEPLRSLAPINYEDPTEHDKKQKRLIERVRTLYRNNELTGLLAKDELHSRALPGESYKLAFTPGLLDQVYDRAGEKLLSPNAAAVLGGAGPDGGGYVDLDNDGHWWTPSGRVFHHPEVDAADPARTAAQELAEARAHFYQPRKYVDPFGHSTRVDYRYDLLVTETRDALGNTVRATNDYRVLQPAIATDPNDNQTFAAFDALGLVVATAVRGKAGEGDLIDDFTHDPTQELANPLLATLQSFMQDPRTRAANLLQRATTRIVYDLDRYRRCGQPPLSATLGRETHVSERRDGEQSKIQISFLYSDGFGRELQSKIQAEPGKAAARNPETVAAGEGDIKPGPLVIENGKPQLAAIPQRWLGKGRTVYNNKGKPIKQYEPFFSSTHLYEEEPEMTDTGVTVVLFYDPVDRVIATLHPNHTYEKVVFDPWRQLSYDVNDTVAPRNDQTGDPRTDPDIHGYVEKYFRTQPADWQPWHQQRIGGAMEQQERTAAEKAAVHADTPTTAHFDALGRPFLTIAQNRFERDGVVTEEEYATRVVLDIEGSQREVIDAKDRIVMRYHYDMLGNRIRQASMEAGERWSLNNVAGKPIRAWDSRRHTFTTAYDALQRPTHQYVQGDGGGTSLVERLVYGEAHVDAARNLRGRLYRHYDQAGVASSERFDFKGNARESRRALTKEYKGIVDWAPLGNLTDPAALEAAAAPLLEDETFASQTTFDALNRPTELVPPHSNKSGTRKNAIRPSYNEANLLNAVVANLREDTEADGKPRWTPFIVNIDYDEKGQRTLIQYGNGTETRYRYDRETFRLNRLYTRRGVTFDQDCQNSAPPPDVTSAPEEPPANKHCGLQNLRYTYDPVGNITHIQDDAQQTIYFKGQIIEPSNDYSYDAIYRLIEATGREHLGQLGGSPIPHSYNDAGRVGVVCADAGRFAPNDQNAMDRYCEKYVYDAVGNFRQMSHHRSCPAVPSWTRTYFYEEASLIEPAKQSNRLSRTEVGSNNRIPEAYGYDPHGNMDRMPQLQIMQWDYKDQLQMTQRQRVDALDSEGIERDGERTWYVYDASGQRVRKVTVLANTNLKDERIYLGGFEIYRNYSNYAGLVRETLHIMDDKQRIGLVETRNAVNDGSPAELVRYQVSNHLGSASLELDDEGQIISYEEYTPYGSTSYQAVRRKTEAAKRYRYTGKERDEESGLHYYGARYLSCWLGRWVSCDPFGIAAGLNLFQYVSSNPVAWIDRHGNAATPTVWQMLSGHLGLMTPDLRKSGIAQDIRSNETSQRILGATLGIISPFVVPVADVLGQIIPSMRLDPSELLPAAREEYYAFSFASSMATMAVGGVETLASLRAGPPAAGALAPALAVAGERNTGAIGAPLAAERVLPSVAKMEAGATPKVVPANQGPAPALSKPSKPKDAPIHGEPQQTKKGGAPTQHGPASEIAAKELAAPEQGMREVNLPKNNPGKASLAGVSGRGGQKYPAGHPLGKQPDVTGTPSEDPTAVVAVEVISPSENLLGTIGRHLKAQLLKAEKELIVIYENYGSR